MKLKEWLETYNGAPYSLEEIAGTCKEIEDNDELQSLAKAFAEVKENFEMVLDDIGFEFG